jgi:hypothetical protein
MHETRTAGRGERAGVVGWFPTMLLQELVLGGLHGIKTIMQLIEIPWPGAATLMWDDDEILDITSGQRGNFAGSPTSRLINMTYRFDPAVGLRSRGVHWAVAYTNRSTKAVLIEEWLRTPRIESQLLLC